MRANKEITTTEFTSATERLLECFEQTDKHNRELSKKLRKCEKRCERFRVTNSIISKKLDVLVVSGAEIQCKLNLAEHTNTRLETDFVRIQTVMKDKEVMLNDEIDRLNGVIIRLTRE